MTNAVNIAQSGSNNVTFRNRIINGACLISQRNGTTAVSTTGYIIDRFQITSISGGTSTCGQIADAPSGFSYSCKYTNTGTTTSNDYNFIGQPIEANNVYDFQWGTSTGISVTLSFWAKANNAGTYNSAISFTGGSANYYYYPTYTITSANTWQYITLTIPAPPTAAGAFTGSFNAAYLAVYPIVIGSSGAGGTTANTWTTSGVYKASGSFNLASTASATFQFTGVQLEAGTTASPFEYRQYGTELALCQRYYQFVGGAAGLHNTTTSSGMSVSFAVAMRTTPSVSATIVGGSLKAYSISSGNPTISNPTIYQYLGPNGGGILVSLGNSVTSGQPTFMYSDTSTPGNIAFSAEL
jgi:hypothetical protein